MLLVAHASIYHVASRQISVLPPAYLRACAREGEGLRERDVRPASITIERATAASAAANRGVFST